MSDELMYIGNQVVSDVSRFPRIDSRLGWLSPSLTLRTLGVDPLFPRGCNLAARTQRAETGMMDLQVAPQHRAQAVGELWSVAESTPG
jgi:hypothetical protein